MHENEISGHIVNAAYEVHRRLGPGLVEKAYRWALSRELSRKGVRFKAEVHVPLLYRGEPLSVLLRANMIVEDLVLVEIKAVERVIEVHKRQLLTYRKGTGLRLGLLLNFGRPTIKEGIKRVVNNLTD